MAALDEPAHLATAALLLAAAGTLRQSRAVLFALTASVAIDADHLPLYAGAPMGAQGRPPTHSLVTPIVLAVAGLAVRRWRSELLGCAVGVGLHLVRDIATGPGIPLAWPITGRAFEVPYPAYLALLVAAAAATTGRFRRFTQTAEPVS